LRIGDCGLRIFQNEPPYVGCYKVYGLEIEAFFQSGEQVNVTLTEPH
jgi:hypothetical protein